MPLAPPLFDWLPVFNAQPGATLLLSPDWVIVGASDDYLAATLTQRASLVGQHLFDAFPDNPATPEANAVANVRASLETVLATKQPHEMAPQHYDVPDRTRLGRFVERHWQPRHTPVLDAQGQVQFIIQSVQDITASRQAERQLRESQAREQAARAEAERERAELQRVFAEAPVAMGLLRGPDFVVEWANPRMGQIWGRSLDQIVGRPHFAALPDLAGQGFEAVFAGVLQTGESCYFRELLVTIAQAQQSYQGYFNITYQPAYDGAGHITGLLCSAVEVTDQVRARQQVQTFNEELAAINEELRASNEEYLATNAALGQTQQQLRQLNQELESRVQERTQATQVALGTAERERNLLQAVLTQAPVAVGLFQGEELRITAANAQMAAIWGRTPEQVLGQPLLDAVPELRGQGFDEQLRQVLQTQVSVQGTETPAAMLRDGQLQTTYYNFVYQPLYDAEGRVLGVIDVAVEVTEQVIARQAREAQQRLLSSVFEQAPAGIWVVQGPDYVFEFVNPLMEQILGHSQPQLLGRPYFEALAELTSQGLPELFSRVWEQSETVFVAELAAKLAYHAPGEMGYFTFVFQPLQDEHGQVARISCVALDVTTQVLARQQVQDLNEKLAAINEELTATNEELHQSNTQLTRTNVDLDTFVYTASHDLKAPITNIESIVLALRDTLPLAVQQDEVVAHLLALLDTTVARFRLTIGQLTDISKLQLAHAGPAEPVQLAQAIENVRLDLVPALAAADTQLTVEVAPELVVSFSPANLRSIVYNLLSNAIKYRALDRPAQVRVHAAHTAAGVVLMIQDNGLGMSEVQQRQLFGLFQRLHTHVEGTGVGLYITKRLVENAGGTITVLSQPGVGTTFTVTFPD